MTKAKSCHKTTGIKLFEFEYSKLRMCVISKTRQRKNFPLDKTWNNEKSKLD